MRVHNKGLKENGRNNAGMLGNVEQILAVHRWQKHLVSLLVLDMSIANLV